MSNILAELGKLPPGFLSAFAAVCGALVTVLLGKLIVTPFLGARDKQDREVEWRKHAIELTKLEVERKLRSGRDFSTKPLRPSILDFLANYRDLQELDLKTPAVLYKEIETKRIRQTSVPPTMGQSAKRSSAKITDEP